MTQKETSTSLMMIALRIHQPFQSSTRSHKHNCWTSAEVKPLNSVSAMVADTSQAWLMVTCI